jgi:energy-coupling factor transporter ATP-binding protein EcfA2
VLLLGQSGAGKSTLAAVLANRPELNLLADDTSPISFEGDDAFVSTGDPELWLLEDTRVALGIEDRAPGKRPIAFPSQVAKRLKMQGIVALSYGDVTKPTLRVLRGHAALSRLLEGTVRFVIDEPQVQLHEISQLEKLVSATRVYELTRPRDLSRIGESADAIVDLFREASE